MGCFTPRKVYEPSLAVSTLNLGLNSFVKITQSSFQDHYKILKPLGSGGFADVKLCLYLPTNQKRAVKIIHKAGLSKEQLDKDFFLQEVKVLKELNHPNILRMYEILEEETKFYVVLEYCEGGELFERILQIEKFSEGDAAEIMHELLSGITYCHEKRVVHRDLKPENILLEHKESSLSVKISDFGSSCIIDRNKQIHGNFGTGYYVAPEVISGNYNEKCDIWSAGILMYLLLTGNPPFPELDENRIPEMIQNNPFELGTLQNLSVEAADLLENLLKIDPSDRISAEEAVNHPWIIAYREALTPPNLSYSLNNLKTFYASAKLKQAAYIYIATEVISRYETRLLRLSFETMDVNGDGKLSRDELVNEYAKTLEKDEAEIAVAEIMKRADTDNSGFIDYSEFLSACVDYKTHLSKQNLKSVFKYFDTDGSGTITLNELREALSGGESYEDVVWEKVIKEIDSNGDGVIDLKEFFNLMLNS